MLFKESFLFEVLEKARNTLRPLGRKISEKIPSGSKGYRLLSDSLFQYFWPYPDVIEVQGSKMYLNVCHESPALRTTFRTFAFSRIHEASTTKLFKEVVKRGDVVVDLGAHIGYFTLLAARLVGKKGKVYAFEPEPTNFGFLIKNIKLNRYDNVIAVQKAVSDRQGKVRLYIHPEDCQCHTIKQYEGKSDDKRKFVEVYAISLDEFFKDKKHQIDVIKMDVEGAEILALSGSDTIIRENKNLKLFVEFNPVKIREMGSSPEEFARKLLGYFSMFVISDDYWGLKKRINDVNELMSVWGGGGAHINLFLEKR